MIINNRLGIFVFYDLNGQVDKYVVHLLKYLMKYLEKLIIISNCKLRDESVGTFETFTSNIYERENFGYDAGAYKYCFTEILSNDVLNQYDEVILFNDSFYGPFFSMDEIFSTMERIDVDVWGITSNDNVYINGKRCPKHIQSYFLAIKKNVYTKVSFLKFWENMLISNSFINIVMTFEMEFAEWLMKNQYSYKSYLDVVNENYVIDRGNPYHEHAYELIAECGIPILKRKAASKLYNNTVTVELVKKYITENTDYDIKFINENLKKVYGNKYIGLKKFCELHNHIYIYGAGKYGMNIKDLLTEWGFENCSFIVTKSVNHSIKEISNINFEDNDGIIIAVGMALESDLYNMAQKYVKKECIYNIW